MADPNRIEDHTCAVCLEPLHYSRSMGAWLVISSGAPDTCLVAAAS